MLDHEIVCGTYSLLLYYNNYHCSIWKTLHHYMIIISV